MIGHLVTTQLGAEDTLRMVGAAFGFHVKDVSKSELLITLEAFLVSQTSQGKRCLLIVDEAQNLTAQAVEELRMLSNFQFGNQALLQSFMVGQPEFREILQRPEMEQFRQRVAATCHIGPLDAEETRRYIEHRLACSGSRGKPSFDDAAFDAIYKATHGIPRRINSLCDRLLLLGFLSEKTHLMRTDVDEVVRETAEESYVPAKQPAAGNAGTHLQTTASELLPDIDLSRLDLTSEATQVMSGQLATLVAEQRLDQLQRVERSILRLERQNVQILGLLQKLVGAVSTVKPTSDERSL